MSKVMVFGTFDILHPGHLSVFKQAKKYGDYLIVVVARDSTVKNIGKKILYNERQRLKNIKSIKVVDLAILGSKKDKYAVIKKYKPDVICLGYDQKFFITGLKKIHKKIIRLKPHKKHIFKSSIIRKSQAPAPP